MPRTFINPYAFVETGNPPHSVVRRTPTFHDGRTPDTYSGTIEVSWEIASPLLLPATAKDEGWLTDDGLRIPGSSIAGAVRSLHEAMFNGCYRIVDLDYVPSYREAAKTDDQLQLAIVTKTSSDAVPTEVRLCDDTVWIDSGDLLRRWPQSGRVPTSGDVIRVTGRPRATSLGRKEFEYLDRLEVVQGSDKHPVPTDSDTDNRVLLVTSTSARKPLRRDGSKGRALWATGRITKHLVTIDPHDDRDMIARFVAACRGTDDRRRLEQPADKGGQRDVDAWRSATTYADVTWWGPEGQRDKLVARRALASGYLFPGDVVWVGLRGGRVTTMKLAQVWRRAGRHSVRQRLPETLHPCAPSKQPILCLTCATFGAVDDGGGTRAEQNAYAGHVRFASAVIAGPLSTQEIDLAPLGQPRPGNGMFYLRWKDDALPKRQQGDIAFHWGSEAEKDGTKRIAGRKFYWHAEPRRQAEHWTSELGRPVSLRSTPSQQQRKGKMTRRATLVTSGTLTSTVTFDQIDAVQVHALLVALAPGRLLQRVSGEEADRYATHLCGGKPFGYGSVVPTITDISITPAAGRYRRQGSQKEDWSAFPGPAVAARVGQFTSALPGLARILSLDGLKDSEHLVTYPPGSGWEHYQHPESALANGFAQSYAWFGKANGEKLASESRAWEPLPRPTGSPSLPIEPKRRR